MYNQQGTYVVSLDFRERKHVEVEVDLDGRLKPLVQYEA
jgi:hypothetical protein